LIEERHVTAIHPLIIYPFDQIPAAFSFMRSGKHIGKIVISDREKPAIVPVRPPVRKLSLNKNKAYLIVGGLKGLCGSIAMYLARHGARHIIAMSRSGCIDKQSQKVIANCNAAGCTVQSAIADVSDIRQVEEVFQQSPHPIGGIIQGAMVLRDKPFESMTHDDFHTTTTNKVRGTWNLHEASKIHRSPLDFFTLLSSISGVIGQKGQANYSAANTFLDAFARYRHTLGLRAHSLDLGVIEDVGYVSSKGGMTSHFDSKQWTPINEPMLHKLVAYSIFQQIDVINATSRAEMITGIPFPQPPDSGLRMMHDLQHFLHGTAGRGLDTARETRNRTSKPSSCCSRRNQI
jgi:NAD(P)-dependent dehydrogenase (short-subunit alcohol dehydrogenase family)